jgi:hypothetical protein
VLDAVMLLAMNPRTPSTAVPQGRIETRPHPLAALPSPGSDLS